MQFSKISDHSKRNKQFELFSSTNDFSTNIYKESTLEISRESLLDWRKKIHKHQEFVLKTFKNSCLQKSLISYKSNENIELEKLNPFLLKSSSINFWRSNKSIHDGPAIYFVIDKIGNDQIILYIGETYSADKRWKGEHDCKNYINNYKESLTKADVENHIDIRFSLDVPLEVKFRRKLEQKLIYLWLPPFNKESRGRWSTTFTNH